MPLRAAAPPTALPAGGRASRGGAGRWTPDGMPQEAAGGPRSARDGDPWASFPGPRRRHGGGNLTAGEGCLAAVARSALKPPGGSEWGRGAIGQCRPPGSADPAADVRDRASSMGNRAVMAIPPV